MSTYKYVWDDDDDDDDDDDTVLIDICEPINYQNTTLDLR